MQKHTQGGAGVGEAKRYDLKNSVVSQQTAMVLMMIFRPRGFVSSRTPSVFLKERKAVSGDLVSEGHG